LATQIGEAWSEIMKKKHNIDIPFNVKNICWKPKDLIEKSFQVPKYSFILLDEWEDASYWSELGMTLRQFFRKCRQLNLFMICIIPNWFQLPLSYAVSRSMFAIDVRFTNNLDRGLFAFYNFPCKRILYIAGKRGHNYRVVKPTFMGRFGDGYGVDEQEYRDKKLQDMEKYDRENPVKKTKAMLERETKVALLNKFKKTSPDLTREQLSNIFGVSEWTITQWNKGGGSELEVVEKNYNNKHTIKEYEQDDEALEGSEQKEIDESEPVNPISTEGTENMGRGG